MTIEHYVTVCLYLLLGNKFVPLYQLIHNRKKALSRTADQLNAILIESERNLHIKHHEYRS